MKKAYTYKGYCKDNDDFDLQCLDGQWLEGCLWFQTYYELSNYVLSLFTDNVIDADDIKEELKNKDIDIFFIEDEIDKIRRGEKSLIGDYVDVIDCENVANIPKCHQDIGYFLY